MVTVCFLGMHCPQAVQLGVHLTLLMIEGNIDHTLLLLDLKTLLPVRKLTEVVYNVGYRGARI